MRGFAHMRAREFVHLFVFVCVRKEKEGDREEEKPDLPADFNCRSLV